MSVPYQRALASLRRSAATGVLCLGGVVAACGGSDHDSAPADGAGGESNLTPANGAGGDGNVTPGDANSGTESTGGQQPGVTGGLEGVWRAVSTELVALDSADPFAITQKTLELPAAVSLPEQDGKTELCLAIEDGQLVTYAYHDGDEGYYRLLQPLSGADNVYQLLSSTKAESFLFDEGALTSMSTRTQGTLILSSTTSYEKLAKFPPSGWPAQVIEVDVEKIGAGSR